MVQFFLRNSQPEFYHTHGSFWLFHLFKNYAETTVLIDKKIISQDATDAVQQSFRRVKSPKTSMREKKF